MTKPDQRSSAPESPFSDRGSFAHSQVINGNDRAFLRVGILASLIFFTYAVYNLLWSSHALGVIETFLALVCYIIAWRGTRGAMKLSTISTIISFSTLFLLTYLIVTGEAFGTGLIWAMCFPFVAFFFNGLHLGLVWTAAFLLINILLVTAQISRGFELPYGEIVLIRAAVAYCAIAAFAYFYEKQHYRFRFQNERGKEMLERLVENSSDVVVVIDPTSEFLFLSPAVERVLGYDSKSLIGSNAFDYFHEEDRARVFKKLARIFLRPGQVARECFRFRCADGSWCMMEAVGKASPDKHGVMTAVLNCRDISEQKRIEDRLLESQKMESVGTLVGGIAHDFNNNLAAMKAALYLAKKDSAAQPTLTKRLNMLDDLASHAAGVVEQLLTFARKDMVRSERYSLTDFIRNNLELSASVIPENIRLTLDVCDEEIFIEGDRNQCQQTLINLLGNARDAVAGRDNPEIKLTMERFTADKRFRQSHPHLRQRTFAHIMVEDNGCGISEEVMPRIFDPFFTTKAVGDGTGLGLSMVYGVVSRHDGSVDVESTPGKGTVVHLYLPVKGSSRSSVSPPDAQHEERSDHDRHTILLADDDEVLREVTAEALISFGHTVFTAADGNEALKIYRQRRHQIDLVISDVIMPNLGGIDLLEKVRESDEAFPFILITGYDDSEKGDIEQRFARCILLGKPFALETLTGAIGQLLDMPVPRS